MAASAKKGRLSDRTAAGGVAARDSPEAMKLGHDRVSTAEQNLDPQG
jgi:hypothetical protein